MKLLLFSDVHGEESFFDRIEQLALKHKVDAMICAGDISWFGRGLNKIFKRLNRVPLPFFFIQGNHEVGEDMEIIIEKNNNLYHIEANPVFLRGYLFVGFGGGGFFSREADFEIKKTYFIDATINLIIELINRGEIIPIKPIEEIKMIGRKKTNQQDKINLIKNQFKNKIVFITHQPPYNCKCDYFYEGHVGNEDYSDLIKEFKPILFVCGHIHETAGTVEKKGATTIVNPGWKGKIFKLPEVYKK